MLAADAGARAAHGDGAMGSSMNGLNGAPVNGSHWDPANTPGSLGQPMDAEWLPADVGSWPRVVEDEVAVEQARLVAAIDAARARIAAAKQRDAEVRIAMHAEVVATQARVAEIEQQYQAAISAVREAGQAEVAGILSEARQRARLSGQRRQPRSAETGQVHDVQ
ncbi:MAG: hypothetical protein AAB131_00340 [Actinomycetota bacterium]|jgi:hypothetical protein|nr:MAG: hypothetical protein FD127_3333 [Acidimicrobiaceae bacterium]